MRTEEVSRTSRHLDVYSLLLRTFDSLFISFTDVEGFGRKNDPTHFSKLAVCFESTVMHILSQDEIEGVPKSALENFQKFYASTAFRCRFPSCPKSLARFSSPELRKQHAGTHFRRIYCRITDCRWSTIGFKKKSGLDAHMRKYHEEKSSFPIPPKVRRLPDVTTESERKDQRQRDQSPDENTVANHQAAEAEYIIIGPPFGSLGDEVSIYYPLHNPYSNAGSKILIYQDLALETTCSRKL